MNMEKEYQFFINGQKSVDDPKLRKQFKERIHYDIAIAKEEEFRHRTLLKKSDYYTSIEIRILLQKIQEYIKIRKNKLKYL